jgi:predicted DNA-binding transcriptional regulator AlpA
MTVETALSYKLLSSTNDGRGVIGAIPEAWPALLSRPQVCAYVGMSWESLSRTCPVPPVALGVNLLRWRRADIDDWISGLPSRLQNAAQAEGQEGRSSPPPPSRLAGEERRFDALERASQRAMRRTRKPSWKKT